VHDSDNRGIVVAAAHFWKMPVVANPAAHTIDSSTDATGYPSHSIGVANIIGASFLSGYRSRLG